MEVESPLRLITCEQNDPCSGYIVCSLLGVVRCRFQRFKIALRRAAVFSLLSWGLEPNIAFGGQSLEIQREV